MAIGDLIELMQDYPREQVEGIDRDLAASGLPTLSEVRILFSSTIAAIMKRGRIRSEVEYYALRNAVESMAEDESAEAWRLLGDFETTAARGVGT